MIIISVHLASGCRCCLHARWRFVCRASVCRARGVGYISACSWLLASKCVLGPSVYRRPGSDFLHFLCGLLRGGLVLVDVGEVAVGSGEDDIFFPVLYAIQIES